jgi:hypothetical protein
MSYVNRGILLAGTLLAASACSANGTVPPSAPGAANPASRIAGFDSGFNSSLNPAAVDTTSILKNIKKDIVIGSTVDPKNGDKAARGISVVKSTYGIKKGQLLVCNFEDKTGKPGAGTTIDVFNPTTGSKAATLSESSKIEGCDGTAITLRNGVYATAATSGLIVGVNDKGKVGKALGSPYKEPFSDVDASNSSLYQAEYIFGSDAVSGGIVSFSINHYGNPVPTEVASGFGVNQKSGWSALGPSGLQYRANKPNADTLYIADGVDNTVVAFTSASSLLVPNEIVVNPGGKTFKCKYPKTTCGKLVYSGAPLDAPVAMTLLPNGNLIVANSGNNTLVELTPTGKVLATKVVDKNKTPGVFGIAAVGTNDSNTALFFTDTNTNNIHELEQ